MPIHVVIADDEYFIRKRIIKLIPWEDLGLTLAGEAENGEEVLSLLAGHNIDLLILDIKMPKLSGIEVAAYVKQHTPNTHIIILSGYDDFRYAQAAIRTGAKEYLLKPVQQKELLQAIQSCASSIRARSDIQQCLKQYEQYEWRHHLSAIRDGSRSYDDLCNLYQEFSQFRYSVYCTMYAEKSLLQKTRDLNQKLSQMNFTCVHFQESECICILQIFVPEKDCFQHIQGILTDFIHCQNDYIYLYLDEIFSTQSNWAPYYQRSLHLVTERYFSADSGLCVRPARHSKPQFEEEVLLLRKNLLSVLHTNEEDTLCQYIRQVFQSLSEKKSCDYLCLVITEIFTIYRLYFHIPEPLTQSISDFANAIIAAEYSLSALEAEVIFYGLECIHKIKIVPSDVAMCRKVTEYLEQHFRDSALSVSEIAENLRITPSYLGSIFKKIHHCSIVQYLSTLRMENAKKLLREGDLKITEIAEESGFSDVYYFSKKFKKFCGCSPKTYANSFQHKNTLTQNKC